MHLEELNLLISNCKTPQYFQKILAHELTLNRPSHELQKLNQTRVSSTDDLNPHHIDTALFAYNSPLLGGAILCDELGLVKTIEAGLIISQLGRREEG